MKKKGETERRKNAKLCHFQRRQKSNGHDCRQLQLSPAFLWLLWLSVGIQQIDIRNTNQLSWAIAGSCCCLLPFCDSFHALPYILHTPPGWQSSNNHQTIKQSSNNHQTIIKQQSSSGSGYPTMQSSNNHQTLMSMRMWAMTEAWGFKLHQFALVALEVLSCTHYLYSVWRENDLFSVMILYNCLIDNLCNDDHWPLIILSSPPVPVENGHRRDLT